MRWTVAAGSAWGIYCALANGVPVASTFAQMAVPWVWVAALVGWRFAQSSKRAALLGGVSLLAANVAYFGVSVIAASISAGYASSGIIFFALWAGVGLVIGPISGLLGFFLKVPSHRFLAVALLSSVSIAEPLALWAHIDHVDSHIAYLIVGALGLVLPMTLLGRDRKCLIGAIGIVMLAVYPTALILEVTLIALGQISPPMRLI